MRIAWSRGSAAPPPAIGTSRAGRARVAARIWSVRPWLPPPPWLVTLWTFVPGAKRTHLPSVDRNNTVGTVLPHRARRLEIERKTLMQPFTTLQGMVMPLDRVNVDTDQIIPQRFLRKIARTGFGPDLFANLRYIGDSATPNPDFVLNFP